MPVPVPEHPYPTGPLAVRYRSYELHQLRAGTIGQVRVEVENAGTGTWYSTGRANIRLCHHWLDRFGNVLVWEGMRTMLPRPVEPGARVELDLPLAAPMPPGPYRLSIDLVDEGRHWFAELGNVPLEVEVEVLPRLARRALAVRVDGDRPAELEETRRALATQEEPIVEEDAEAVAFLGAGCVPAPDWSRRVLDAHDEGFVAVGGSVEVTGSRLAKRGAGRELVAWAPGFGRSPSWSEPLLCPSLLTGELAHAPWTDPVAGLPALDPGGLVAPWLCDGRIRLAVRATALQQAGRRHA